MTIDPQIQQLSKHDFLEYLLQLQVLAKEKYSFDIFIENSLPQEDKEKSKEFANLSHYKDDIKVVKQDKRELGVFPTDTFVMADDFNAPLENVAKSQKNIVEILDKYTGAVSNIWNEDAQIYVNRLREDDREF